MNITIRDLDDTTYRKAKGKAALENKTIGQAVTEALKDWLAKPRQKKGKAFLDILNHPEDWGPSDSSRIDEEIYR